MRLPEDEENGARPSLLVRSVDQLATALEAEAAAALDPQTARYRQDPLFWAQEVLGVRPETLRWSLNPGYAQHAWDGTPDPLAAVAEALARGEKVIAAESGVGTGKTVLLAVLGLWFLDCWEDSTVVTIAPKEDQLKLHSWRWVSYFMPRFKRRHPRAELGKLSLRLRPPSDIWTMTGFVAGVGADEEVAGKAQGFHDKDMLFLFEETTGIKKPLLTAFELTAVAPHNQRLYVGNPNHRRDTLHQVVEEPGTVSVRISALDHPNVVQDDPCRIEGAVTRESIEKLRRKHGELGPRFLSRVRGISPAQAADALIRLEWVFAAQERWRQLQEKLGGNLEQALLAPGAPTVLPLGLEGPVAAGIDVANSLDGDFSSVAWGRGAVCVKLDVAPCPNANELGADVAVELRRLGVDAERVGVDGVGVGVGTLNELLAQGYAVQNLIGNAAMDESTGLLGEERFLNWRAQGYWLLADDLRFGRIALPPSDSLTDDLTVTKYRPQGEGIAVEKKEVLRRQLGRSPNEADSVMYWNWVRQVSPGATRGGDVVSF